MTRGYIRRLVGATALIVSTLVVSGNALAGDYFLRVSRASDIPAQFDPSKPLIIKGTVPPGSGEWSESQLEGFGRKLAQINSSRRQKVAVLLIEHFNDEAFRMENVTLRDYTAVQAVVENGLKANTAYADGDFAFLCICFQKFNGSPSHGDRPFEYWPSKQLKEWRLGVGDIWKGDLKEFMLNRLKARNIPESFLDTAVELNNRLDRKIQAEINRKAELKRQGQSALRNAEAKHAMLLTNLTQLRADIPGRNGDVFFPDLSSAEANLESARAAVEAENYARAKEAGDSVVATVTTHQTLVDEYRAEPKTIEALQARILEHASHPYASAGFDEAQAATKSADSALKAYMLGSSEFLTLRNEAELLIEEAENAASSAQARHRAFVATMTVLGLGILAAIAIVLFLLRKWSVRAQASFERQYKNRRSMLLEKRAAQRALQRKKIEVIGASKADSELGADLDNGKVNKTQKDADRAGTLVGDVFIMFSCADRVLSEAAKKATPAGLQKILYAFSGKPWKAAEDYLSKTPVSFNKQSGLRFALDDDKEVSAAEALWKDISEFDDFEMSFFDLIDVIADKSRKADNLLDGINEAVERLGPSLSKLSTTLHGVDEGPEGGLDERYDTACGVWTEDGEFVLNVYPDTLIPALDAEIERLTTLGKRDPVTAYEEIDPLKGRVEATGSVIEQIEEVASAYDEIASGYAALVEHRVNAAWVKEAYNAILNRCDAQLQIIAEQPEEGSMPKLAPVAEQVDQIISYVSEVLPTELIAGSQAEALKAQVNEAVELAGLLRETLESGIETASDLVRSTRISIASGIDGAEPDQILVEFDELNDRDYNPDTLLTSASRFVETSIEELGEGDVEAARKAYNRGAGSLNTANKIVERTVAAHQAYAGRVEAIEDRGVELADQVDPHTEILIGIEAEFDAAVLKQTAGDNAHPDANGTIADNFEEIEQAVQLRENHLQDADEEYQQGRILEAEEILEAAEAANGFIQNRLDGVAKKRERLDSTVEANVETRSKLERRRTELGRAVADPRVMKPTIAKYNSAVERLSAALELFKAEKPNPFKIESELKKVTEAFWSVDERIKLDHELHAEAERSLDAARKRLTRAKRVLASVAGDADNIPDSDRLAKVPGEIRELKKKLKRAEELFNQESGDWNKVDELVDDITDASQRLIDVINAEAADGQSAVETINSAARKVREAINWSGSYGVSVYGRPGSKLLDQARQALDRGDYAEARELAERARRKAASAIADAEAEVARKRREEEERRRRERERRRREEAERRRQAEAAAAAARRRRRASSSSSSSFGSGGGGFGGFSSGGGGGGFGGFSSSGGGGGW